MQLVIVKSGHEIVREKTGQSIQVATHGYDKKTSQSGHPVLLLVKEPKRGQGKIVKFMSKYEGLYFCASPD